jgi:Protein of unknown function (DUF4058)
MPIHDWARVRAGKFHHFHNSWIYRLSDRLNAGLLPPGLYAAGEQIVGEIEPDVLTLQRDDAGNAAGAGPKWHGGENVLAVEEHPPKVRSTMSADESVYVRRQDQLAIRAVEGDRLVAVIEIVSAGNKSSRHELERLLRKAAAALTSGIHLLIVDLQPPGNLDPDGIHGAVWEYLFGSRPAAPADRRLTLVAYRATPPTAYVEPAAVGDKLPDMPLFLDSDSYVSVPLEETYAQAWQGFPPPWKEELQ